MEFDADWSDARERVMTEYLETHEEDEWGLRRDILEFQAARRHERFEKFMEKTGNHLAHADPEAVASFLTNEFNFLDRLLPETMRASAISVATSHGYLVTRYALFPSRLDIIIKGTVSLIGDVDAPEGTMIYADYDLLSREQGGLTGLGGGFIVNVSAEWDKSLNKHVRHKVQGAITDFANVCTERTVRVIGHVSFISAPGSVIEGAEAPPLETVDIGGNKWFAGVISPWPLTGPPSAGSPWILSYWNSQAFQLPQQSQPS